MYRLFQPRSEQNKEHCWIKIVVHAVFHSLFVMSWTHCFILTILFSFLAQPLFSSQGFLVCPKQLTVIPLQNVHNSADLFLQI